MKKSNTQRSSFKIVRSMKASNLQTLHVGGNTWQLEGSLAEIDEAARGSKNVSSIRLDSFDIDVVTAAKIVATIQNHQDTVTSFKIVDCSGHLDIVLSVALASLSWLQILTIEFDVNATTNSQCPVFHSLGVGLHGTTLRSLSLRQCAINSSAASSIEIGLAGNHTLKKIELHCCQFHDNDSLLAFSRGLKGLNTLTAARFDLVSFPNSRQLNDKNVAHLIKCLENNKSLVRLEVNRVKCHRQGLESLAILLDKTTLRHLDISRQIFREEEVMDLSPLVSALGRTTTLDTLKLSFNRLSDYDLAFIAPPLAYNTSIRILDLSNNKIKNRGLEILCSRIPKMAVLEQIYLCYNPFNEDGAEGLLKAITQNKVLKSVEINPDTKQYMAIRHHTDLNCAGTAMLEQSSIIKRLPMKLSLWPLVLARANKLPEESYRCGSAERRLERQVCVLYHVLRHHAVVLIVSGSCHYDGKPACSR